ncbi:MAG: polysaccharide lyase family 7 protein [Bacteroidota bacterium]
MNKKRAMIYISFLFLSVQLDGQEIDLTHWKITIPATNNGKVISVRPPEIKDFRNNEVLKPYFFEDPNDGALVFYASPAGSTANSKYSRSELREQMEPGNDNVNWTFAEGGLMRGTLAVTDVTQDEVGNYHRVIVMQIHGRLTDEQRDLIGEDDNNAPPILKIYWNEGKVTVATKYLKDLKASETEILHEKAWGNPKQKVFKEIVGYGKFTLQVKVSKGRMEVSLNDNETFVFDDIHMEKWGVFENYFKAGNYFQSRDKGSHAYVKYYELEVSH